jgi:hypothetical protein
MSRFCFVGEPPRRKERALVSLSKSTASVVSVCRLPRWIIARVSGIQAGPRANGREPALQGAWSAWCKKAELSDPADSETTKEAPQCRVCITSGSMSSIDLFIQTTHPVRCIHSLSMASAAANFRSVCGSERGAAECSTQRSPAAAPHLGQGTEDACSGVSSFFFIRTELGKALFLQLGTSHEHYGV